MTNNFSSNIREIAAREGIGRTIECRISDIAEHPSEHRIASKI